MATQAKKQKNENVLYSNLMEAWNEAYKDYKAQTIQRECNEFWKANKKNAMDVEKKITELKLMAAKKNVSILSFFTRASLSSPQESLPSSSHKDQKDLEESNVSSVTKTQSLEGTESVDKKSQSLINVKKPSFIQDKHKEELRVLEARISSITTLKSVGLETEDQRKQLKEDLERRKNVKIKLNNLEKDAARKRKSYHNFRQKWEEMKSANPAEFSEWAGQLKLWENRGRPPLSVTQPSLLKAIIDIISPESSADEKRRTENLTAHLKLNSLHEKVTALGYELSRSALYLRLLPRRPSNAEGHRHVTTVPVRLIRPQNDKRKFHTDAHFCAATIKYLKDLCEIMGDKAVFVVSQDDKAKVPLGIPAAKKQAPILMRMQYKVRLPDHDFVVAPGHKLTPSVYAGLVFTKEGKLGYSGPTYIAIRSSKHSKTSAESHGMDFRKLVGLENFRSIAKTESGHIKPVVVIFTDGGADENPRFEGPFKQAALHFRLFNLDAIFVATHAPGHSAYNQVERKMAPLSRDLAGVVLPHEYYGTHLNNSGKTIDQELERKNFDKAGQCLADLWNGKVIDKYAVVADAISSTTSAESNDFKFLTQEWISVHVRQSQYCLQIMKCDNKNCCSPPRTIIKKVLNGFLPSPCPFTKTQMGPSASSRNEAETGHYGSLSDRLALTNLVPIVDKSKTIPFDYYCPSLKSKVGARTCRKCGKYFPTIKFKNAHWKYCKFVGLPIVDVHQSGSSDDEEDVHTESEDSDSDNDIMEIEDEDEIEVIGIENLGTWYEDIFEECDMLDEL